MLLTITDKKREITESIRFDVKFNIKSTPTVEIRKESVSETSKDSIKEPVKDTAKTSKDTLKPE